MYIYRQNFNTLASNKDTSIYFYYEHAHELSLIEKFTRLGGR